MKYLRSDSKRIGGQSFSWFWCEACEKDVLRQTGHGKSQKTCGCLKSEYVSKTKIWKIWNGMRDRCEYKKHDNYKNYGAKGISVCDSWKTFYVFRKWAMTNGFREGLSIDRINSKLGYCPENCRFVTPLENSRNHSGCILSLEKADFIRANPQLDKHYLAKIYGVQERTIIDVRNNKVWVRT